MDEVISIPEGKAVNPLGPLRYDHRSKACLLGICFLIYIILYYPCNGVTTIEYTPSIR